MDERGISQKDLCVAIDMTPAGFRGVIENQRMTVKQLESICSVLKVPPHYFFDSEIPLPAENMFDLAKCKQQVIELQAEVISLLKNREKP